MTPTGGAHFNDLKNNSVSPQWGEHPNYVERQKQISRSALRPNADQQCRRYQLGFPVDAGEKVDKC